MIYEMSVEIIFSEYKDYDKFREKFNRQEPIDFNGHPMILTALPVVSQAETWAGTELRTAAGRCIKCELSLKETI